MATRTESRSAAAERVHHRTNLLHQAAVFVGLFLSPIAGLLTAWLIHLWANGMHVHHGPINWDVDSSPVVMPLAVCLVTLTTVLIAYLAHGFAEHRKPVLRNSLAGSVVALGVFFAINVGTGPDWFLSGLFICVAWAVAVIWSIARLDVTRNDKREDDGDDGFLERHNLKGWRARKVQQVADDQGRPLATEVEFQHAEGDTVDQLQDAVPAFESATASPAGFSRAQGGDRADRSTLTVMHRDPLRERMEIPPASAPGGCITEALTIARYANGELQRAFLAGGAGFSPSGYMFMGMSRTGKTHGENQMITEVESRRNSVILYLNKAKGLQDIRPIIPGIEVAVVADDSDAGGLYRHALRKVKAIMSYRQRQLALFGISEWNAKDCWDSPPWRTESGRRVQMERMPFLIVHVGEADAILASDGGEATYIASKGLSLGVCPGWSLQRADATKMPTGLRFNIGTAWCFGCGDDISASFALSDPTIKAGAHPEYWKQSKPGYHFFEGVGIDDTLFPVMARTFSDGPGGTKAADELLRRNLYWAPRMAKLDRGSVLATADEPGAEPWWAQAAKATDEIRNMLLAGSASASATPAPPGPATADDDGGEWDDDEWDDDEMREEMREVRQVEGVDLYPDGGSPDDATAPLGKADPADHVSWEDDRPAARDRMAAIAAFRKSLVDLSHDEGLRDPADPTGNTVIVTARLLSDRYPYRSRPFYAAILVDTINGKIDIGENLTLSPAPDLGPTKAKYRLQRLNSQ